MSKFKFNTNRTDTQQLAQVMDSVNDLLKVLTKSKNSGVSVDFNSNNNQSVKEEQSDNSVEIQQDETLALTIELVTPLGTITFSISLDLPIEEVLNLLLDLITTVVCALFPDLDICESSGTAASENVTEKKTQNNQD